MLWQVLLLPQEGFRELHTWTPNSVVVKMLSWVAQDPGPNPLSDSGSCWNQHLSGGSWSSLPGVPKYSWAKQGNKGFPALQMRHTAETDCWAPTSAAVNTKQISTWRLAWPWPLSFPQSFAGACWSVHSPGRWELRIVSLSQKRGLAQLGWIPTNRAINSSSCSLEQLWIYPFFCFGFCGCAQTIIFWMEYFVLIEMRLCSFLSSAKNILAYSFNLKKLFLFRSWITVIYKTPVWV